MKYILLALMAVICSNSINAQSLRIYKTDGTFISVPYSELDSIVAVENEEEKQHEFVDLGLSVKWATCNVGAEAPEDFGCYFAWGEIEEKQNYNSESCKTLSKSMSDISGIPEFDAARALWGGTARMPKDSEFRELMEKCTMEWVTQNLVSGMKITGPNGNSIFLPAAGSYENDVLTNTNRFGYYWSSTPYALHDIFAYYFCIAHDGSCAENYDVRDYGQTIRPVSE